jgi:hypothetical protein
MHSREAVEILCHRHLAATGNRLAECLLQSHIVTYTAMYVRMHVQTLHILKQQNMCKVRVAGPSDDARMKHSHLLVCIELHLAYMLYAGQASIISCPALQMCRKLTSRPAAKHNKEYVIAAMRTHACICL